MDDSGVADSSRSGYCLDRTQPLQSRCGLVKSFRRRRVDMHAGLSAPNTF